MSRRLVRIALALAAPVLALLVLRAFFCDVYRVDSGSMEPTLHGDPEDGELVLVRYAREPRLERFDLVVLRRPAERAPFIKRVVGLPGERVQIVGGDLLVNGARLPAATPRPAPIPVFDTRTGSFSAEFQFSEELWTETPDGWLLDSARPEPLEGYGVACFRHPVTDGFASVEGGFMTGLRAVGDLVLESEVRLEEPGGMLVWSISEGGDRFEVRLEDGSARLVLLAPDPEDPLAPNTEELLAEGPFAMPPGRWTQLRLASLDDVVSLDLRESGTGGSARLRLEVPHHADSAPQGSQDPSYRHVQPRACLGGAAVKASFRDVRVLRDLHYTNLGAYGLAEPLNLGPGEIFVLGDNSADSADGREWGAVRLDEVLGFAEAVVWPPAQMRRLRPVVGPE